MVDDASMDTKFDDFAKRDRPTLGRTDTAAYKDKMDASKKRSANVLRRTTDVKDK